MKKWLNIYNFLLAGFLILILGGCYSFKGGSVPDHLKTIFIASVADNSGFGNPQYKDQLTNLLIDNFRRDNSLRIVESGGDARLVVAISSISERAEVVSKGELETERKITVNCDAEYFDNVKKKIVWKKNFSSFGVYRIADAQTARNEALKKALEQSAEDITLAVVSGW